LADCDPNMSKKTESEYGYASGASDQDMETCIRVNNTARSKAMITIVDEIRIGVQVVF